jgi:hypothetical protein
MAFVAPWKYCRFRQISTALSFRVYSAGLSKHHVAHQNRTVVLVRAIENKAISNCRDGKLWTIRYNLFMNIGFGNESLYVDTF